MLQKLYRDARIKQKRRRLRVRASWPRPKNQPNKITHVDFPVVEYFVEANYYLNHNKVPHVKKADFIPLALSFKPFFKAPIAFFIPWIGVMFGFLNTYSAINYWICVNLFLVVTYMLYKGYKERLGLGIITPLLQVAVGFLFLLYFFNLWIFYHDMQDSIIGFGPITNFPSPEEPMLTNVQGRKYKKSGFIRSRQEVASWWS